jgi:hypothetical protein
MRATSPDHHILVHLIKPIASPEGSCYAVFFTFYFLSLKPKLFLGPTTCYAPQINKHKTSLQHPMLSGSPVTTAWCVLRLRLEETAPDEEGNPVYTE